MANIIFDPVLGWRRAPGRARAAIGDSITWEWDIDPTGFRRLPNARPGKGQKKVWVFGCSFTEGQCLPIEQTYCYLLQDRFGGAEIQPYAIAGYSSFQNLLQLQANLMTSKPDVVVFGYFHFHLIRNVAHPILWKNRHSHPAFGRLQKVGSRSTEIFRPAAFINEFGKLNFRKVNMPLSEQEYEGMMAYAPDRFTRHQISCRVFEEARALTEAAGAKFVVAVLRSGDSIEAKEVDKTPPMETMFVKQLLERGFDVVDADPNKPFEDISFYPTDIHPNSSANKHFAAVIGEKLDTMLN
ncbi:hypothetical protein [Pseudooctadecabacter jejudonensis]|uniref:hypothetical protein n=1 Tax=Pseudooctadecabacter jejudonensis TaxID=1391910 RepID=UPI00117B8184|nr:hypothetical protein [Pseudooctadecabacter jejudonensis]